MVSGLGNILEIEMNNDNRDSFLLRRIDKYGETIFDFRDDIVSIGTNPIESLSALNKLQTSSEIINFRYNKAKKLIDIPHLIRLGSHPHVTLLGKYGLLIGNECSDEEGFTPCNSVYFWSVGFTGENFQSVGLHQWMSWSWGIPTTKDIIELDRWSIPGEIGKHNARIKAITKSIVQTIEQRTTISILIEKPLL